MRHASLQTRFVTDAQISFFLEKRNFSQVEKLITAKGGAFAYLGCYRYASLQNSKQNYSLRPHFRLEALLIGINPVIINGELELVK